MELRAPCYSSLLDCHAMKNTMEEENKIYKRAFETEKEEKDIKIRKTYQQELTM